MKLKISALFFFVFSLLFLVFPLKNAHADTFALSGSVTDGSGNAIGNAAVHVYTPGTTTDVVSSVTTDTSTGVYSFSAVPSGTYDVKVIPTTGSGFSSAIAFNQNISTNTTLNFILNPTGTITLHGHIFDRNGTPVQNAKVSLQDVSVSTITDATGSYSLTAASGTHTLDITGKNTDSTIALPAYYDVTAFNYSLTQSELFDITLPTKQVTIHVQDGQTNPISGVGLGAVDNGGSGSMSTTRLPIGGGTSTVWAISEYGTGFNRFTPQTDASGNVNLWVFQDGINHAYNFTATPPTGSGFLTTNLNNISVTADTQKTITLQQPVTLSGHLYDRLGHALVNQTVQFTDVNVTSTTDSTGFYSLTTSPGTHTLVISGKSTDTSLSIPGYYKITANGFSLTQTTTLDFTIPTKQVTVHVQDAFGNALSGVSATAVDSGGPESLSTTHITIGNVTAAQGISEYGTSFSGVTPQTDASGNATLWLFANNSTFPYNFTITPPSGSGYQATTLSNTNITADTTLTVTLQQPITIHGQITDRAGHYVTGATVKLQDVGLTTTTDSTGSYFFNTSAGVHTLDIHGTNSSSSLDLPSYFDVTANNVSFTQSTTLNITIPAQQVSLHVQDATGNPVSGVGVSAQDEGGSGNPESTQLSIGGGITNAWGISEYGTALSGTAPQTDASGNVTLWLFANSGNRSYLFTATPQTGSIYKTFTLNNVVVTGDQTELIALQYNHATPVTTATLSPAPDSQGNYSDPTTVTLVATAASGYSIANTYYTLDGGTQQTYSAPFTVSGNGSHTITYWSVDNAGVPEATNTKTFTILTTYSLSGKVYNDANQNGFQDSGETGVSGVTITLNTGQTATTDTNGNYTFSSLIPGTYTETLTVPNGDVATTTNPATISLAANTTQNFGIAPSGPTLVTAINAGGDTQGSYGADADYTGGTQYTSTAAVDTSNVTNPAPEAVYQSVRYGNFSYTIPGLTPGGTYTVRLHFNELYWGTSHAGNNGGVGSRIFNVSINGTQVLTNYDIYDKAGGANIATTEQFSATPDSNGNITIQFTTVVDNAMVNGIEVYSGTLPAPTPTPTPTPAASVALNAGGVTQGTFMTDKDFSGGQGYTSTAAVDTSTVINPALQAVYQSARYGNFTYIIPHLFPNTNYTVRLHFNEFYWGAALAGYSGGVGSRVFNVSINGTQVLGNYDIFQDAGGANIAVVKEFTATSDANGKVTIQFSSVVDNAMVNGIELTQQ